MDRWHRLDFPAGMVNYSSYTKPCRRTIKNKSRKFCILLWFVYLCKEIFILMNNLYKIKQGLDLPLEGEAPRNFRETAPAKCYAVMPQDFHGITPRMMVKEGEEVCAGTPLFVDKATGLVKVCSPVSGRVKAIVRGERRKILRVEIESDGKMTSVPLTAAGTRPKDAETALRLLVDSGLLAFMRTRPYDVVPRPDVKPRDIFVSAFSKMPLAADFSYVVQGAEADFKAGVHLLSLLANVHVGIAPHQINTPMLPLEDAQVSVFDGPNPAGCVGVQINRVAPVNKGETVWTIAPDVVVMVGRMLRLGHADYSRKIALAGALMQERGYVNAIIGTPLTHLLDGHLPHDTSHIRIICGNPLVGNKATCDGYLSAMVTEVCIIPEGDDRDELLGWIAPRCKDFSTSRSYFSWLMPGRKYNLDCRIKGGERHMIMSGEYDRVFPMDIYAGYLIKAILTGDIDRQEQLGIYEVAPEDFAVAEFVDSSKLELQRIVREGLDILRKENE